MPKDINLNRADIEWLLATHEDGRGPVDWSDESQRKRKGLDLRGAYLSKVDLSNLPLACMRGALSIFTSNENELERLEVAAVHLEGAKLFDTHLEGAILEMAHLEGVNLGHTHLLNADLCNAYLEGAWFYNSYVNEAMLIGAHLEGTNLLQAHFEGAHLGNAHLEGSYLGYTHLEGAYLIGACLEGKEVEINDIERIRKWKEDFPKMLHPAELRGTFFDTKTNLEGISLGNKKDGFVWLSDIHWDDVNVAVIDWTKVNMLGNELKALQKKRMMI